MWRVSNIKPIEDPFVLAIEATRYKATNICISGCIPDTEDSFRSLAEVGILLSPCGTCITFLSSQNPNLEPPYIFYTHTYIYIEYIIIHSYINIVLYIHHIQIHEFLFLGVKGGAQPELPTARCLLLGSEWPSYARARARGPWSVLGMAWYTISKWLVYGWWISFKKGIGLFFLMASYLTST